jgi:hypothetical protein
MKTIILDTLLLLSMAGLAVLVTCVINSWVD